MTSKLRANPVNLLDENFDAEPMHPADIEQIIIASIDEYENLPRFHKIRKQYREAINSLIRLLAEKRNFQQFGFVQ